MTAPRAWVRPDGTLPARAEAWLRSDGVLVARANDGWDSVEVIHERDPDPSDATPLVAAPKVDGDDPRAEFNAWLAAEIKAADRDREACRSAVPESFRVAVSRGDALRKVRARLARLDAAAPVARDALAATLPEPEQGNSDGLAVWTVHDDAGDDEFGAEGETWTVQREPNGIVLLDGHPIGPAAELGSALLAAARLQASATPVAREDTASPDEYEEPRGLDQATTMDAWTLMGHVGDAINHRSPTTPVAVWVDGHPREVIGAEYDEDVERLFIKTRREIGWGDQLAVPAFIATYVPENDDGTEFLVEYLGGPTDRWHRWAVRGAESAAAEVVRTLLPRVHAVRVHRGECGGSEPSSERPAPAQPTEAPDAQRAAPTRKGLVEAFKAHEVSSDVDEDGERCWFRADQDEAERMADVALGVLRSGGAAGGGEDEGPATVPNADNSVHALAAIRLGVIQKSHAALDEKYGHERYAFTSLPDRIRNHIFAVPRELHKAHEEAARLRRTLARDRTRLGAAAGVSPDSEDPVGAIEAAIRAGREPEVVTGAEAARLMEWLAQIDTQTSGSNTLVPVIRRMLDRLAPPAPAPAPLQPGDEVTGVRAVTAPIDTTLRCTTAAVVALRTVNGWSLTGWTAEADPEHHVRVNTWRVVEVGEGGGES